MKNKNGSFVVLFRGSRRDEVFLVFRQDSLIWNLPGGGIEKEESPEDAAVREALEETGFKIELQKRLGTYKNIDIKTGGIWNLTYLFEGKILSGEFSPEFLGSLGRWFKVNKLPTEINSITKVRIIDAVSHSGKYFTKEFRPQTV